MESEEKQKEKTETQEFGAQPPEKQRHEERIVRILSRDIEGKMSIYAGLAKVKGVSWGLSNAICHVLGIDRNRKIGSLTDAEVKKITESVKNPSSPAYLLNRRADFSTGTDRHLTGSDLELQHDFDIKRLKQIRSYRGFRHSAGLPVRGQRTKSHFRKNRAKGAGIKRKTLARKEPRT